MNREINILTGDDFRRANGVLKGMVGKYLSTNTMKTTSYDRIHPNDFETILNYFVVNSSTSINCLQEEIIFNILWFFQLRGRENLRFVFLQCRFRWFIITKVYFVKKNLYTCRFLTKNSFAFANDGDGREYCYIQINMIHKNVKASLSSKEFSDLKQARMYSSDNRDPVQLFKTYLSMLPAETKDDCLFPLITKTGKFSTSSCMGKDTLGNLMNRLSKKLNLSKPYVNHCLRVTGINKMHEAGMSNEAIAAVTGHKSAASVQRYIRTSDKHLRTASSCLSSSSLSSSSSSSSKVTSTSQINNSSQSAATVFNAFEGLPTCTSQEVDCNNTGGS